MKRAGRKARRASLNFLVAWALLTGYVLGHTSWSSGEVDWRGIVLVVVGLPAAMYAYREVYAGE